MPVLDNKRVYLSSPMEFASNKSWTDQHKAILTNEFKLKLFDPWEDEKQVEVSNIQTCITDKNSEGLRTIMKGYCKLDLGNVDRADIIIAYVPHGIPTTGVTHEVVNANNAKKVVLLVEGQDKFKIAKWFYGFIPLKFMFSTWDDLYQFLRDANKDLYKNDDRFYFLYNYPKNWLS